MPKMEYKSEALMRGKILFLFGLALGYVLGTRAGRERYAQIKAGAEKIWSDPRVQKQVAVVGDFVKDKAPEVAIRATSAAKKVSSSVRAATGGSEKK
jgi:oxygen-dependent protoporphyrinogen oxidase